MICAGMAGRRVLGDRLVVLVLVPGGGAAGEREERPVLAGPAVGTGVPAAAGRWWLDRHREGVATCLERFAVQADGDGPQPGMLGVPVPVPRRERALAVGQISGTAEPTARFPGRKLRGLPESGQTARPV
jgi:hypothetical protein